MNVLRESIAKEFGESLAACKALEGKKCIFFPKKHGMIRDNFNNQNLPFVLVGEVLSDIKGLVTGRGVSTMETVIVAGLIHPVVVPNPFKHFFQINEDFILIPEEYLDRDKKQVDVGRVFGVCESSIIFHAGKGQQQHEKSTFLFKDGYIAPILNIWPSHSTPVVIADYATIDRRRVDRMEKVKHYLARLDSFLRLMQKDIEKVTSAINASSEAKSEPYGDSEGVAANLDVLQVVQREMELFTDVEDDMLSGNYGGRQDAKDLAADVYAFLFGTIELRQQRRPAYRAGENPVPMSEVRFPWNFQLLSSFISAFGPFDDLSNILQFRYDALPRFLNELASRRLYWIPAGPFLTGDNPDSEYLNGVPEHIKLEV
jgi:hypothetical protein